MFDLLNLPHGLSQYILTFYMADLPILPSIKEISSLLKDCVVIDNGIVVTAVAKTLRKTLINCNWMTSPKSWTLMMKIMASIN